jgi:hypothetical protein
VSRNSRRIQVSVDQELERALQEYGGSRPRSRTLRDLALVGAATLRDQERPPPEAIEFLRRFANGEFDDQYDWDALGEIVANRR